MFGFSRDKAFAAQLVTALTKDLPPTAMDLSKGNVSVNKITRQLEKTYLAATAYQKEHKPGFMRRAILANNFRWGLKSAGYTDDFIAIATEGLVVELSKALRPS
jgi:hypothetical protein